jgi:cation transport ATPase
MVGSALSAQNGVLIKGGPSFEVANKIKTIIFDKTGTLTLGKPILTNVVVLNYSTHHDSSGIKCYNYDFQNEDEGRDDALETTMVEDKVNVNDMNQQKLRIIKLAATIEQGSQHPLALAVLNAAAKLDLALYPLELNDTAADSKHQSSRVSGKGKGFKVTNGMGVECHTPEGNVAIGNRAFFEKTRNLTIHKDIDQAMFRIECHGRTAVCVSLNDTIIGVLGIADAVKPDALVTIAALHSLNIEVWMVTGDNPTTANAIASQLNIPSDRVLAGVLPAEKASKIIQLQNASTGKANDRRYVAMVGDGINDSPALAQADLGIAVGAGTQVAIEAADMVLIKDSLQDVVVALDLAKFVFQRIRINFGWAVVYNLIAIPFAAGVWYPWTHMFVSPQYAGLAMAFSSVSVVLSSLALRLYRRPEYLFHLHEKKDNKYLRLSKDIISQVKQGAKQLIVSASRTQSGQQQLEIEYTKLSGDEHEEADPFLTNIM